MNAHDRRLGAVFSALADPTRRRLLGRLAEQQSATATELARFCPFVASAYAIDHPLLEPLAEAAARLPSR